MGGFPHATVTSKGDSTFLQERINFVDYLTQLASILTRRIEGAGPCEAEGLQCQLDETFDLLATVLRTSFPGDSAEAFRM
jgi:hypothetical protein